MFNHLGRENHDLVTVEAMSTEAVTTSEIEGEILNRAACNLRSGGNSVSPSIVGSYPSLLRLLDDNFADLFTPDNLWLDLRSGNVRSRHYDMAHVHDFTVDADCRATPDFAADVPFLKEKFTTLVARMERTMNRGRILAVREELQSAPYGEVGVESRPQGERRLDGAGRQRDRIFPNAAVDLPRGELRGADECFSGLGAEL